MTLGILSRKTADFCVIV